MQRRCKVCGAVYETCYSCEKQRSWRVHTDTADHYYIFTTLMTYEYDRDAKKAYRALRKRGVDFLHTSVYEPTVEILLDEIYEKNNADKAKKMRTTVELGVVVDKPVQAVEAEAE